MTINAKDIIAAIKKTEESIYLNEKFPIPTLAVRARQALARYPSDNTLRSLCGVLTKMAEHEKIFITRGELQELYNKFASYNNVAKQCFADELGFREEKIEKKASLQADGGVDLLDSSVNKLADQALVNAFSECWDAQGKRKTGGAIKYFDKSLAAKAINTANLELIRLGMEPRKIESFAGTPEFIMCDATYETPRGDAHVLIPVEVNKQSALFPTMFVSAFGLANLSKEAVSDYVRTTAGRAVHVDTAAILGSLSNTKKLSALTETELKVLAARNNVANEMVKTASSEQTIPNLDGDKIVLSANAVDPARAPGTFDFPTNEKAQTFGDQLNSPKGLAQIMFGSKAVDTARNLVTNKFASLGHNVQVAIASNDDDSITFAIKLDSSGGPLGFEVPVEIHNKMPNFPTVFAANDKVYEISKEGIAQAITEKVSSRQMLARVSPLYEMRASDVLDKIRKAADAGNVVAAEEALTVLGEIGDSKTYSLGLNEYLRSLSSKPMTKQAATKSKCRHIVASKNHEAPVCGHLNLPLDKVYQDEYGDCCPLYRKRIAETEEGTIPMLRKVFNNS